MGAAYQKELRLKRNALGFCARCGKRPHRGGRVTCEECKLQNTEYSVGARIKKARGGICPNCGDHLEGNDKYLCNDCKSLYRERRLERIRNGICTYCGIVKENNGINACNGCSLRNKNRARRVRESRRSSGKCADCNRPRMDLNLRCIEHYLKMPASRYLSRGEWRDLLELYLSQDGKCYLCQEELILGPFSHLDHKIPAVRFGTDHTTIENLAWACKTCNFAKRDLTDLEFIALCKKIAEVHRG